MAGSVKKRVDTGRWRARYRGPDGRERSKDFDRKGDADRWLREQTRRVDAGEWTDPRSGKVTVGEYAPQWLAGKVKIKETTRESYSGLLETQVLPTWGRVPLSAVRHEDVAAWATVDAAFVDGVVAYLEGIPAHWNPATRPTPEGIAWSNGWHDAQHARLVDLDRRWRELKRRRAGDVVELVPWRRLRVCRIG